MLDWDFEEHSILTKKGEHIEYSFGKYLKEYIDKTGLKINSKKIYCNSTQRTLLTAKLLTLSMFPLENLNVEYMFKDLEKTDPQFELFVDNENVNKEKLKQMDIDLKASYNKLEKILGLKKDAIYSLGSSIDSNENGIIRSNGAFRIGTDIVDMFILKYYEGFNLDNIFKSKNFKSDLKEIIPIRNALLDVIFADKKYIENSEFNAYNLLKKYFKKDNDYTLLVGHDSNIATILSMLDIDTSKLGNEFEKYPIGAKLIFKIYEDETFDLDIMYHEIENIRRAGFEKPICVNLAKNLTLK